MRWLLRPSTLVFVSILLALGAATLAIWPRTPVNRAIPLPMEPGDQEVVWLYQATNAAPWERFVSAIGLARKNLESTGAGNAFEINDHNAFPDQSTVVSEISLSIPGRKGRLWFRWYKLTSDLKTQDWVEALLQRRPPLAVIGGSTSDLAIELAQSLRAETDRQNLGPAAPLLFLTTATADATGNEPGVAETPLHSLYPARTYRFCFTNRQMAEAVIAFIWSRFDLRPDAEPFYLTFWQDDPYSTDLNRRFCDALRFPAFHTAARDWAWQAGAAALGGVPVDVSNAVAGRFRMDTPFYPAKILYSVGAFGKPNRWEVEEAQLLMETLLQTYPQQQRPLLVVPAQTQPARRFLRALVRRDPVEARRFVVATGDAIAFNTVYQDRNIAWSIQDLPFALVFFCHRNPTDPRAGFPIDGKVRPANVNVGVSEAPGTEDLLLYLDIVDVLFGACFGDPSASAAPGLPANAAELRKKLHDARWSEADEHVCFRPDCQPLFDGEGNRRSGTGEHVVLLRPVFRGNQVLPEARLEVNAWQAENALGKRTWRTRAKPLVVLYEGHGEQDSGE